MDDDVGSCVMNEDELWWPWQIWEIGAKDCLENQLAFTIRKTMKAMKASTDEGQISKVHIKRFDLPSKTETWNINHDLDKYNASDSLVKIEEGYNLTNHVWGEPQQTIGQFYLNFLVYTFYIF